jgi:hypothetical protein
MLTFLCRPGMFVNVQDRDNFISFISGYELGSKTCSFSEPLGHYIRQTQNTELWGNRWIGDVEQVSALLCLSWTSAFRRLSLNFIASLGVDPIKAELQQLLVGRLQGLIRKIHRAGDPWFNLSWTEEWDALSCVNSAWFKSLWTEQEFRIVKAIDLMVQAKQIFADNEYRLPTRDLLRLKAQHDYLVLNGGNQESSLAADDL